MSGRFGHNEGLKTLAPKTAAKLLGPTEMVLSEQRGVDVAITSESGDTQHYQAQSVTLQIVGGGLEVLHDHRGCYAWFEQCRLEARAGRKRVILAFASGVVSSRSAALTVVAVRNGSAPSTILVKKRTAAKGKNSRRPKSKTP